MINYRKKPIISFHRCCRTFVLHIYLDWSDEFGVLVGVVPLDLAGGAAVALAAGPCARHTGELLVPQLHDDHPDDEAL